MSSLQFFCSIIHLNLNIPGEPKSGHLVKWNNATSSLSQELTMVNSGSALFPITKARHSTVHRGIIYQSFLIFKHANLKNILLRHRAIDVSSLAWRIGDSIPKHWPVMGFYYSSLRSICPVHLEMLKGKITSQQQPKIYIYIYFIYLQTVHIYMTSSNTEL